MRKTGLETTRSETTPLPRLHGCLFVTDGTFSIDGRLGDRKQPFVEKTTYTERKR